LIELSPLDPGRQDALEVARRVADFVTAARDTLDLALYDVRLPDPAGSVVREALEGTAGRGVTVRLAYNLERDEREVPLPPPPSTEPDLIESLRLPTTGIPGIPDLMHHKYMVRDARTVWTGSTNWTQDAWSLQENVIATLDSEAVAAAFRYNFEELWTTRQVDRSGRAEPRELKVGDTEVRAWFTPGQGRDLSHRIADAIGRANRRVRIASPVITAGPILGTLAQEAGEGRLDLAGVVDAPQCEQVFRQWRENGRSTWKIPLLAAIFHEAPFAGKPSTPYAPGRPHDYMHAKVTVCDDVVFCGSFNLSRSGELNAENVLEIHDSALADQMAAYVDDVRGRYPAATAPPIPAR
jgi:phosphatidylserine/phosphatidylglycerophosphate/cardiolipin synthase-like enzyme